LDNLTKISLAISIIGIGAIAILSLAIQPEQTKISSIDNSYTGRIVSISGTIKSSYSSNGNAFLEIDGGGKIKAVMFENDAKNSPWVYEIRKGDNVSATGKIQIYKNEIEIIADSVKVLNVGNK